MFKKATIVLALAAAAISAQAQTAKTFYVGGDLGNTQVDDTLPNLDKLSYGVFGGYKFNDNFAAEVGYRHLLKASVYGIDLNGTQTAVSVLGMIPVTKEFQVFGRLGYNKLTASASAGGRTYSADTNGALYGVGVNYQFNDKIGARIEYQRVASDTKNLSVGVHYSF